MAVRWTFPAGSALATADGATAGTAALVDISPAPVCQIPPVWELGMRIRIHAMGWYTCGSTATNATLQMSLGKPATAIASATLLTTTDAHALTTSQTQVPWDIWWWGHLTALSTPASATAGQISGRGRYMPATALTTFGNEAPMPPTYAGRLSAGFDTTFAQNLLIGATLSQAVGSPQIACETLTCELSG